MNANPRYIEHGMGDFTPPDDSEREAAIERRTEELIAEMWQDPEYVSDAFRDAAGELGWYRRDYRLMPNHPDALSMIALLRDESDPLEFFRRFRIAASDYISGTAKDRAEEEFGV